MSSILVTIPDSVASAFINHLAKLEPSVANQITIRVLEDAHAKRVIEEFNRPLKIPMPEFPVHIPDDELDDDILPLEDLLDHTGGMYHKELEDYDHYGREYRP